MYKVRGRAARFLLWAAFLCCLLPHAAFAQTTPLPGPADPGRIIESLEPELPTREAPAVAAPTAPVEEMTAPDGAEEVKLILKEIKFKGGTVFSQAQLQRWTRDYIRREITLKDLFDIASRITNEYRRRGYFLSKAFLPPQEIDGGIVTIEMVEGYIGRVRIEGDYRPHAAISSMVRKIETDRPANIRHIEEYLMQLNDLAGLNARTILEPLEDSSGDLAIGMVLLLDSAQTDVGGRVGLNNYGSRYIGPLQTEAQLDVRNLFGLYGVTTFAATTALPTDELVYVSAQQTLPLSYPGLSLMANFSYSSSAPGFTLSSSEIESDTFVGTVRLTQSLIRSRSKNLSFDGQFDIKNIHSDILDTTLYDDQIRALRASVNYDMRDRLGGGAGSVLSATISQGLDVLGANESGSFNLSRARGRSDFTKFEANAARLQSTRWGFNLYTALRGQYTDDVLLSAEEFGFGGSEMGRAYDSSEIAGDRGVAGTIEARVPIREPVLGVQTEPYAFYDLGKVWNLDPGGESFSAASAGAGLRLNFRQNMSGNLTFAVPLTKEPSAPEMTKGMNPSITFGLSIGF